MVKLFTHTDLDGIGCAILAHLAFDNGELDISYCDYDNINEQVEEYHTKLKLDNNKIRRFTNRCFITDISIKEDLAQRLNNSIDTFHLIDHHPTALNLDKYGWCIVRENDYRHPDQKTSGTKLFYSFLIETGYLVREKHVEEFVEIVTNYDTWRWSTLGIEGLISKQINDLLHIYGREDFIQWALSKLRLGEFLSLDSIAKMILNIKQREIDAYIDKKDKEMIIINKYNKPFGVVFAESYFSELGNKLCTRHPEIDFVAMIDISTGTVSYRAVKDIDLGNDIAKPLGGGGHPKAAGSRFSIEELSKIVTDNIFI